jgi:predicted kinase
MKILTIMRAVSASGKSFIAEALAAKSGAVICSADYFFMVDGEYQFDPRLLGRAHKSCQDACRNAMITGQNVIIDNTNINIRDAKPYIEMAAEYGYMVQWITVEMPIEACKTLNAARGSKAIPDAVLDRQHSSLWNGTHPVGES